MAMEELKKILNPISEQLKNLRPQDKHDHWLGQEIGFSEDDYSVATHVLIGCPQDEGVRRNNGRPGAAEAPVNIRKQLYILQHPKKSDVKLFDAGDIIMTETAEISILKDAHDRLTKAVLKFLKDKKRVIVLGGGNDISYADVRALSETEQEISAINIDAHLDMRLSDQMTSGTPYRKLIEDGYLSANTLYEFGIRPESNADYYLEDTRKLGMNIHYLHQILENGVNRSFQEILDEIEIRPFFLGLDMDSIRAADAPGSSAASPTGFSGREVMHLIRLARQKKNLKLFEITEVNPKFDVDNRTVKLASQLIYGFLFG